MNKYRLWVVLICLSVLAAVSLAAGYWTHKPEDGKIKVGFVFSEDESTPYTANFVQAQRSLKETFGDKIEIYSRSNVQGRKSERPLIELIQAGCRIIFINLDADTPVTLAREYPNVEFCQVSLPDLRLEGTPENYHTFNGEIYQARYVSGVIAGMKLRQLIDSGALSPEDAVIGYVGANDSTEVISGYTAFLLGVRSLAPEATMRVRYTGSWSNYHAEKEQTRALIDEGCVMIAQHVNTTASAVACEEATSAGHTVFHIGYHQSMMDIAPSCALASVRTNWTPYITEAVQAVMERKPIEQYVNGHIHGRDISAGFDNGWVELLELNNLIAADGSEEKADRTIKGLISGRIQVFSGNYIGVNPRNPSDTIDLSKPYQENQNSSNPSFGYILRDYIIIENSGNGN